MTTDMITTLHQNEIFRPVIGLDPVDVVNNLIAGQKSTKFSLHNKPMLSYITFCIFWMIWCIFIDVPVRKIGSTLPVSMVIAVMTYVFWRNESFSFYGNAMFSKVIHDSMRFHTVHSRNHTGTFGFIVKIGKLFLLKMQTFYFHGYLLFNYYTTMMRNKK